MVPGGGNSRALRNDKTLHIFLAGEYGGKVSVENVKKRAGRFFFYSVWHFSYQRGKQRKALLRAWRVGGSGRGSKDIFSVFLRFRLVAENSGLFWEGLTTQRASGRGLFWPDVVCLLPEETSL